MYEACKYTCEIDSLHIRICLTVYAIKYSNLLSLYWVAFSLG